MFLNVIIRTLYFYLDLDEKPVASASLAQVHKGKLKDGTLVAVKV